MAAIFRIGLYLGDSHLQSIYASGLIGQFWFSCGSDWFSPATAQVDETSVTNNSLFKDYLHPDDRAQKIFRKLNNGMAETAL